MQRDSRTLERLMAESEFATGCSATAPASSTALC